MYWASAVQRLRLKSIALVPSMIRWAPAIGAGSANRGFHPESAWLLLGVFVAVRRVLDPRLPVQVGRASGYRPAPAG